MYNSATTSQENAYSTEAKYTVADILSSMANGEGFSDPSYSNGVTSVTTPTSVMTPTSLLTPSTLTTLEQTFMDLQQASDNQNASRQSGFVPPVVDPRMIKQEHDDYYSEDSCDPEWTPPSKHARMDDSSNSPASTPRSGPRRHTGPRPPRKHEVLTPEESERRKVRRERNKQAAAKCRQRRVDHTNELIQQTEDLEDQKSSLESDIKALQQQKEQLEFLLEAHRPLCESRKSGMLIKAEPKDSETTDMACQTIAARPRPNTLLLSTTACSTNSVSSATLATGIPIHTPSNGVFATLGLDSMVDGHTGLTPITGAPTSCANDLPRHMVDSDSSNSSESQSLSSPTTLIAL